MTQVRALRALRRARPRAPSVWLMVLILGVFAPVDPSFAGAVASSVPAAAATSAWPGVPDVEGSVLATVEISDRSAGGFEDAVIVASLWPTFEARDAMEVGDSFHPTPIDRESLVGGRATIDIADEELVGAHRSADGTVVAQVDVFTDDGIGTVFVERVRDENGRWVDSATRTAPVDDLPPPVAFRMGRGHMLPIPERNGPAEPRLVDRHHHSDLVCTAWYFGGDVEVGETVLTSAVTNGIRARVTYSSSATTTSGVGISFDAGATWSASGTSTRTSGLTANYDIVTGAAGSWSNKEWRATWGHKKYWRHCPGGPYDETWHEQRQTWPHAVVGFPAIIDSRYPMPRCHTRHDLTGVRSIDTEDATATTYGAAFEISWGAGTFSGNAQSGYSTHVRITFETPTPSRYWYWCGNTFYPAESMKVRAGR